MWSYFAFTEFMPFSLFLFDICESWKYEYGNHIFFKTVSVYSYVLKHWKLDVDKKKKKKVHPDYFCLKENVVFSV